MITLNTIQLPGDMVWEDEFEWTPVVHDTGYSCSGALLIEASTMLAGRPITLRSGEDFALVTRAVVLQLQTLLDAGDDDMILILHDGREFTVKFRRTETAMGADPEYPLAPPADDDLYNLTLRLIEVS